jgi:hypothetical protein
LIKTISIDQPTQLIEGFRPPLNIPPMQTIDVPELKEQDKQEPIIPEEPQPIEEIGVPFITTEMAIIFAAVIVAMAFLAGFWIIRKRK